MVLLEQIADDSVDALVNLGCCLYKVKHVLPPAHFPHIMLSCMSLSINKSYLRFVEGSQRHKLKQFP